jgi:hypothetical protein
LEKITVIDALPGRGKTEALIKLINNAPDDEKFLYITPYLDEVVRIRKSCTRQFYEPDVKRGKGSKQCDLQNMIGKGFNIASTHSLFLRFDEITETALKSKDYTLILDESITPVTTKKISKYDFEMLVNDHHIEIDDRNYIRWIDPNYKGEFDWMKYFAERNCLVLSSRRDSKDIEQEITIWIYPIEIFKAFKSVYIATFKIQGSLMYPYMLMNNLGFELKSMDDNYNIVPYDQRFETADRERAAKLINVYMGNNLNAIGDDRNALSKTYFTKPKNKPLIKILKDNLYNWFRNKNHAQKSDVLWTTFEDFKHLLSGKGYTKGFIECNKRATNEYRSKTILAYCINRFEVPIYIRLFADNGIELDEEALALSDMIQWIWRSAIRDEKPIQIYIPSSRMRHILLAWLKP